MKTSRKSHAVLRLLLLLPSLALAVACANMGRPEGGARDETPPRMVRAVPAPATVNFTGNKLHIYFDENVQLDDAFNKVVVSPAQKTPPSVSANGRHVTVELLDTLRDSTTYTVDFGDAIKDLNEGNILDGFAIDFATGPTIDTLRISGTILAAENLEPAQGMLVGAYANLADSAILTLPMEHVARTNQYGQFTIRNLPAGQYRLYAVNDLNRDFHWDRAEDGAFLDEIIVPSVEEIMVTDTLFAADGTDSLHVRPGLRYLPNDLLLTWFNEGYKAQYVADNKRPVRRRIDILMGAPSDSDIVVRVVDGAPGAGRPDSLWAVRQANATLDSLHYWITDPDIIAADSLRISISYVRPDSLERPVWTTDTLRMYFRDRNKKKEKKKPEAEAPRFIVDSITGDTTFLPPPDKEYFNFRALGSRPDLDRPLILEADLPWGRLDSAGMRLEYAEDTIWHAVPVFLRPDSLDSAMRRRADVRWQPGTRYRLTVDSLAAHSVYDSIHNRPYEFEFTTPQLEDYSNLVVTLPGTDTLRVVVELLSSSDEPVYRAVKPVGATTADIRFITPGSYYLRAFIDSTPNGRWDTGNMKQRIQPEEVFYFAKKLNLKRNWDVEQTWDIYELAVDAQKPYAIKKNKPKLKRGEAPPVDPEEETEEEYQNRIDPFTPPRRGGTRPGGIRPAGGNNTMAR